MKRFWVALLATWMLAVSWCAVHITLTHRAEIQNQVDPDEIDFDYTPPESYDV